VAETAAAPPAEAGAAPGPDGHSIIIAGEYHRLGGGVKVVTFNDPGAEPAVLSFYAPDTQAKCLTAGTPCYSEGRLEKGKTLRTLEELREHISQVVFHIDGCRDAAMCFTVLRARGLSTHFIIDWDGTIFQVLDVRDCAYHGGEANGKSVGIDLNNLMKNLVREPDGEMYPSGHTRYEEMMKPEFKRPKSDVKEIAYAKVQAYGYTEAQYTAIIELLRVLQIELDIKNAYPIGLDGEVIHTPLEDAASHEGFIAHWHWESQRWDPGPGFDWQRIYHALAGGKNAFPIDLEEGKNIGTLLEPAKVKAYAEQYYKHNETQTSGWYPIGANQTWHGGIHLSGTRGQKVFAMMQGVLVLARFGRAPSALGHNNFIVLKHTVPMAQPILADATEVPPPKNLVFYSLYMHLDALDFDKLEEAPQWLRDLLKVDAGKTDAAQAGLAAKADDDDDVKAIEDTDAVDGSDPDVIDTRTGWLKVGEGVQALRDGKIAKIFHEKNAITVKPGDFIGRMGLFGVEDEPKPQIHVEIFAEPTWKDAIDMGVHGRFLQELPVDVGADLFVENRDILSLFGTQKRRGAALSPQRVLDPTAIEDFWTSADANEEARKYTRRLVTRHVSEWSDMVDWVLSLSKAEGWDQRIVEFQDLLRESSLGRDAIRKVLPFIWLNKDVARHIGLDVKEWRGILDHFHPIHFLLWLMYNSVGASQGLAVGVSKKKAQDMARKEAAEAQRCAQIPRPTDCAPSNAEEFVPSTSEMIDEVDLIDGGRELESWFGDRDVQREWKRPERGGAAGAEGEDAP
jgi:N-acetylmuramoyl-L-alanine amidase